MDDKPEPPQDEDKTEEAAKPLPKPTSPGRNHGEGGGHDGIHNLGRAEL